jgi:hypothetical protein
MLLKNVESINKIRFTISDALCTYLMFSETYFGLKVNISHFVNFVLEIDFLRFKILQNY